MVKCNEDKMLKIMLWKDILIIPTYTVLFYNSKALFWMLIIIDRLINIFLSLKSIKMENLIDKALESEESQIMQLLLFVAVTGIILYIIMFIKHRKLFYILISIELVDYIMTKLCK